MTREQVIELMRQHTLADIIKVIQQAYKQGFQAGYSQATADQDDIPF